MVIKKKILTAKIYALIRPKSRGRSMYLCNIQGTVPCIIILCYEIIVVYVGSVGNPPCAMSVNQSHLLKLLPSLESQDAWRTPLGPAGGSNHHIYRDSHWYLLCAPTVGPAPSEVFPTAQLHLHVRVALPHIEELLPGIKRTWIRTAGVEAGKIYYTCRACHCLGGYMNYDYS